MKLKNSKNKLISNAEIYGINRTKITCQYPMNTGESIPQGSDRLYKLGKAKQGSGHDCALKGLIIRYDINAPAYFWQQWQRYHFSDIASSQSKMHRINSMNIDKQCNKYVNQTSKDNLENVLKEYRLNNSNTNFQRVLSNTPMGLNLKADCVSNMLQEKSKYNQRRHHKLEEWQEYCDWLEYVQQETGIKFS